MWNKKERKKKKSIMFPPPELHEVDQGGLFPILLFSLAGTVFGLKAVGLAEGSVVRGGGPAPYCGPGQPKLNSFNPLRNLA